MKKQVLAAAIVATLGAVASLGAQAAVVNNGDVLTITAGVPTTSNGTILNVPSGSWFGMDTNGSASITGPEKTPLAQGVQGLVIGVAQNMGGYNTHSGPSSSVPGDSANVNAPWDFFGNTGKNFTTVAVTGSTTAGLNLSGWTVSWNGIASIPMGSTAWGTGFSNGIGNFTWDGTYGHTYTLDYHGTVPHGDPSNFGDVKYALHLVGTVTTGPAATAVANLGPAPVPVPAAVWLFGSGLLGLVGIARRKKSA